MTPDQLTQSLKAEAKRLQFSMAGCCPAVSPTGFHQFLEWLDRGYAGEMEYLETRRDAYQHPSGVMPGVKSLLMLAMDYSSVTTRNTPGKIAKYATGTLDYHDVIHSRLKQLKRFAVDAFPGIQVRGVVDTAPLLEREFAQLAGLGWIGKNTLLLNKSRGSLFFLAALLIDQELIYDQPTTAHCGTCTACLDACPTQAFPQPYVLNASRCISYLTIEHRSPIPVDLRESMDGWVFGCDVCQDVCPWNRMASGARVEPLQHDAFFEELDFRELFSLDDDGFRKMFRKTPLWRPRRRGMLRNAAIALASKPSVDNVDSLVLGAKDCEPLVRGASLWSLSRHLFPSVASQIRSLAEEILTHETDEDVLVACQQCLTRPVLG